MQIFELPAIESQNQRWLEFLRVNALSVGLYQLKAGQVDSQKPHTEDEVYYVVTGKATFVCGDERRPVSAGSVIFVERFREHCFAEIVEDLSVLVFFAPPEGSNSPLAPRGRGDGGEGKIS